MPPTLGPLTGANRRRLLEGYKRPCFLRRSSQASSAFITGTPPGYRLPGFHLVFPGSLRGWPTTPVRSLAIRFQRRTRWTRRDSNPRPPQCHCGALPTALRAHAGMILVDPEGLEPSTPTMPLWCAPNCATGPRCADNGTGGAEGTRTPGLYSAIVALSHLSYSPTATGTLCQAAHVVYENPLSCQVEGFGASGRQPGPRRRRRESRV